MTRLASYRRRSPLDPRWPLQGVSRNDFSAAVVIPVLAERAQLPLTLEDLRHNPASVRERTLIVVVVNERSDATAAQKKDNKALLDALPSLTNGLHLGWINATSATMVLPSGQGVGLARRLGMEQALERIASLQKGWIACLDADTRVDQDYLPALYRHFRRFRAAGAVLPFVHQKGSTEEHQQAIAHYETYLKGTALGLALAGSPYAYVSLGSAMACRCTGYLASGGMPQRLAGEDFYFLQQLRKVGGVAPVTGTCVAPSARRSQRTPFGTGEKIDQLLDNREFDFFYPARAFDLLEQVLSTVKSLPTEEGEGLVEQISVQGPQLEPFLRHIGFARHWDQLRRQHSRAQWSRAFHTWFDGLKTIRLLNALTQAGLPRQRCEQAMPPLYQRIGRLSRGFYRKGDCE